MGNLLGWQVTQGDFLESRVTQGVVGWQNCGGCYSCCAMCVFVVVQDVV